MHFTAVAAISYNAKTPKIQDKDFLMIQSVGGFIDYYASIRRRTLQFVAAIPADRWDWAPAPGEYTFGDLVRHLAAAEQMFVGAVALGHWQYPGHHALPASDPQTQTLLALLDTRHQAALHLLRSVPDSDLNQPRVALTGQPVKTWRLLLAMVEHEVHHRSQLAMYLTLLQVTPPHLYGLGVEDVIALATS